MNPTPSHSEYSPIRTEINPSRTTFQGGQNIFQREIVDEEYVDEMAKKGILQENRKLKRELHEMRKRQVGWYGKG